MRDLGGEELEEPVELVGIAPQRRHELRRVGVRGCLERTHLHLQAAAEALDPAEHPHGVALREPPIEQLDVVPDARVDPAARVDELQRRYAAPFRVRRRSFRATAYTPSTVLSSTSSAIVVTARV